MDAEFDQYADKYEQQLAKGLRLSGESRFHFLGRRVRRLGEWATLYGLIPGYSVLDFGCGTGEAVPVLLESLGAARVLGYDVSVRSLQLASQRFSGPKVEFSDRLASSSCSLAYVNGVFHHIPVNDRLEAMKAIHSGLEDGGLLGFFENNPLNPLMTYSMRQVEFDKDAVTLTHWEARNLLQRAGFRVLQTEFLFFFPAFLRFLRPLEPLLRKLPLGAQYLLVAAKADT